MAIVQDCHIRFILVNEHEFVPNKPGCGIEPVYDANCLGNKQIDPMVRHDVFQFVCRYCRIVVPAIGTAYYNIYRIQLNGAYFSLSVTTNV